MERNVAPAPGGLLACAEQAQVLWLHTVPPRGTDLHLKLPRFNSSTKIAMVCKGRKLFQIVNIPQAPAPA